MILGIDLGTKNSLIGYYADGVCLVKNSFDSYMTPSVVHIEENGDIIVGELASARLLTHPGTTFEMFKRDMGTKKTYKAYGNTFTPTQLSSFILESLVNDFKSINDSEIEGVVISVPAYFNENQRYETKRAGQLIGLNVIQVLNEPSAAALYATQLSGDFDKSLILDLGGGTFDITVAECFEGVYEIISIAGDTNLGGQDYTTALVDIACKKLGVEKGSYLYELCDMAKISLVADDSVAVVNYKQKTVEITFEEFYDAVSEVNEKIFPIFYKAINDANISDINEIENIIFIGGGSKSYAFRKYIYELLSADMTNEIFSLDDDCDLTVVKGLALYTATLVEASDDLDIVLTDVCPFSLGVDIIDRKNQFGNNVKFLPIISRNETLPVSKSHSLVPVDKSQKEVVIKVYQGESLNVANNLQLGEIIVPCNDVTNIINVTFTYDINSILKVNVQNFAMKIEKEVYIHHDKDLSEEDKNSLIKELNSIKYIDRQIQRQKYYKEKLYYIYENGSIDEREYCTFLIDQYENAIARGTNKERVLVEERIDNFLKAPLNLKVGSNEFVH